MEMNSIIATEIVAAEVEHIVLPQIVSIKQASRMLGCRRIICGGFAKRFPALPFSLASNGISTWENWLIITTMREELPQDKSIKMPQCQGCHAFPRQPTPFIKKDV